MCSTCNHVHFDEIVIEINGRSIRKLEKKLDSGDLVIRCDPDGRNYVIAVNGRTNSDYKMYRCPTCGHKFLD